MNEIGNHHIYLGGSTMTADERKFERARVQTVKDWGRLLFQSHRPLSPAGCGFCEEYQYVDGLSWCCVNCPLSNGNHYDCVALIHDCGSQFRAGYFSEDGHIMHILTVLICLHHMAANFITVDGEPLQESPFEEVEV